MKFEIWSPNVYLKLDFLDQHEAHLHVSWISCWYNICRYISLYFCFIFSLDVYMLGKFICMLKQNAIHLTPFPQQGVLCFSFFWAKNLPDTEQIKFPRNLANWLLHASKKDTNSGERE